MQFDGREIEQLLLNATEPHAQLTYDGWLLRFAPDDAKRAGSIIAVSAGTRPLEAKIERCEQAYIGRGMTPIFRVTNYSEPPELDDVLYDRGYRRFDASLVQACEIPEGVAQATDAGLRFEWPNLAAWSEAAAVLHDRTPDEAFVRLTRLKICKVPSQGVLAWQGNDLVGCAMLMQEGAWAGLFEVMVEESRRRQGVGKAMTVELLAKARSQGATHAWLSVVANNAAAQMLYARFGFETVYGYWYREPKA